jgi:hypothetical protein
MTCFKNPNRSQSSQPASATRPTHASLDTDNLEYEHTTHSDTCRTRNETTYVTREFLISPRLSWLHRALARDFFIVVELLALSNICDTPMMYEAFSQLPEQNNEPLDTIIAI